MVTLINQVDVVMKRISGVIAEIVEEVSETVVPTLCARHNRSQKPLCDHEIREECNEHALSPQQKRHKITCVIHGHLNYLVPYD